MCRQRMLASDPAYIIIVVINITKTAEGDDRIPRALATTSNNIVGATLCAEM